MFHRHGRRIDYLLQYLLRFRRMIRGCDDYDYDDWYEDEYEEWEDIWEYEPAAGDEDGGARRRAWDYFSESESDSSDSGDEYESDENVVELLYG